MPHIDLPGHLPGITGLLEYRQDSAAPIRNLTQYLLRADNTLTMAERELIASLVSYRNGCRFCATAHTAAADLFLGEEETCRLVKEDLENAPVTDKMKALLKIAAKVQQSGKTVDQADISAARNAGATDLEIHDTVLIAALFCLYNKYVDGMGTLTPSDPAYYKQLGERITTHGYTRLPQGYDYLKTKKFS